MSCCPDTYDEKVGYFSAEGRDPGSRSAGSEGEDLEGTLLPDKRSSDVVE